MGTKRNFTMVVCGLALWLGWFSNLQAQEAQDPQILFLHLRLTNGVVHLIASTTVPGRLKPAIATEKPGDLYLELVSTNSLTVWSGVVSDPLVRRYEYEDPEHPGQLKAKEVKLDQAEFTVRVPGRTEARQLNIYRLEPPATQSGMAASRPTRTLMGTIQLPGPEVAQ
jgi:hypothetical protein